MLYLQENGDTALHLAVKRKDVEMAKLLIDFKADVNMQNVSFYISVNLIKTHSTAFKST